MPTPKAGEATPSPTFTEAVETQRARLEAEAQAREIIIASAPTPAGVKTAIETPPAPEAEETYEQWLDKQPQNFRDKYKTTIAGEIATGLYETYGPEITQILEAAKADPELKKRLARMTDKQFRDWALNDAAKIYDETAAQYKPAPDPNEATNKKIEALEKGIQDERDARELAKYQDGRRTEFEALLNTFPELNFHGNQNSAVYKRALAVVEETERQTQKSGKVVPYAETYTKMREMWTEQAENPPPPHAPRPQADGTPPKPQAPRNKSEGRAAIKATLDKFGGLSGLQAALRK